MAHHIVDSVLQLASAISFSVAAWFFWNLTWLSIVLSVKPQYQQTRISRECPFSSCGRSCAMNECRPHYSKSGAYQQRRRALLLHCTPGPGSAMSIALRSLRHDMAADKGASWGSTIFSVLYAEALVRLQSRLLDECVARVVCPNRPFDPDSADTGSAVPIIDIVYVDDLAVFTVAASPASLRRAPDALLMSLIDQFTPLGLVINWNPGKTEIMLKFRGTASVAQYEQW